MSNKNFKPAKNTGKLEKNKRRTGWLLIIVPSLLIILFYIYPMFKAFWTSLHAGAGVNLNFVGFNNYIKVFKNDQFKTAVFNTFIYLIFQIPIMILLALIFSVLLNKKFLRFKGVFRTIIFLPAITSLVSYSIVFKYLFSSNGIINKILLSTNIIDSPIQWLGDTVWAKVLIIIAITWRWTGYNMIFYLAGLQNIDHSIYESAHLDGANEFQIFRHITVPLLKPVILFTSITSTIGTLQLFDEPMNITQGGPGNATLSISQYIYNVSFRYTPDFGYASAISFVVLIFIVILSAIQFKVGGSDD